MNDKPILQENEEIRDIKGYEGIYAVTSYGRVWSYRRNKFLKPADNGKGYLFVVLSVNGQQKTQKIHRLVAQAFLANPDGLPQVNHKDENKDNNRVSNLEWCDNKYNVTYSIGRAVRCIELNKVFNCSETAAKELHLAGGSIRRCCKGKQKTVGGYHWEYVEGGAAAC